jgi:hypothetical protein
VIQTVSGERVAPTLTFANPPPTQPRAVSDQRGDAIVGRQRRQRGGGYLRRGEYAVRRDDPGLPLRRSAVAATTHAVRPAVLRCLKRLEYGGVKTAKHQGINSEG